LRCVAWTLAPAQTHDASRDPPAVTNAAKIARRSRSTEKCVLTAQVKKFVNNNLPALQSSVSMHITWRTDARAAVGPV
jgi:hypothetical protein